MRKLKTLVVLLVVTGAAVAGAVWSQKNETSTASTGDFLFPGLMEKVNDVTTIAAKSGDAELTLETKDGTWVVVEKENYPARTDEIRNLLIGAAELKRVEAKTAKAELFAKLEVEDPTEGAESIRYTLKTRDGAEVATLVVGKRQLLNAAADIDRYYVRVPAEGQAWLVEGQVPKHRIATDWLATEVVSIAPERIHRTSVKHADGTTVRAVKAKLGDANFALLGIPPGRSIENDYTVHALATTIADLALNDVTTPNQVSFDPIRLEVVVETFDGLRITLELGKRGDDEFFRLKAAQDTGLPTLLGIAPDQDPTDPLKATANKTLHTAEAVANEVTAMNEQWSKWAYRVQAFHLDSLRKKVPDLLKPETDKTLPPPPSGSG